MKNREPTPDDIMKTIKRIVAIFFLLCIVNAFVFWAEPLWLHKYILPFGKPEVLVSPNLDKIIKVMATILALIQLPSGLVIDLLEKFKQFSRIEALLTISAISTGFFVLYRSVWLLNSGKRTRQTSIV